MKNLPVVSMMVVLVLSLGVMPVNAHDIAKSGGTMETDVPGAAEKAELADFAASLVEYGTEQQDPILLLGAVRIMDKLPAPVLKRGEQGKDAQHYDRDEILALAEKYDGNNGELGEMIADMKAEKKKHMAFVYHCHYVWVKTWSGYSYQYICH